MLPPDYPQLVCIFGDYCVNGELCSNEIVWGGHRLDYDCEVVTRLGKHCEGRGGRGEGRERGGRGVQVIARGR